MGKIRPHCYPQSRGDAWQSDDDLITRSFNGNKKRRRVAHQRCADFLVDTSLLIYIYFFVVPRRVAPETIDRPN